MPLTLPGEIFASVSPAAYLLANLEKTSLRANGRRQNDFRKPVINAGSLGHCFGSSIVRAGDTAVVCGVRGEILLASDVPNPSDIPDVTQDQPSLKQKHDEVAALHLLVPNVELATGCSPAFLPGNPPSTLAQSLSQRVLSLLHSTQLIDARDLRITFTERASIEDEDIPDAPPRVDVKAYWTLYIDIMFISANGNAFDAAWGAMLAALRTTKIPRAWWDADAAMVLCSDLAGDARTLNLRGQPIASTFVVFNTSRHKGTGEQQKDWAVADPDAFEEGICEESLTIVVDGSRGGKGSICKVEKSGGFTIGEVKMRGFVDAAEGRWREWQDAIARSGG